MKPGDLLDQIKTDAAPPSGDQIITMTPVKLPEDPFPLVFPNADPIVPKSYQKFMFASF
jgi:hypothetical protein